MERHECGEVRVIPIILRTTLWEGVPFEKLQVLPTNAEPVSSKFWHTPDDAFVDVAKGIRKVVNELISPPLAGELIPPQISADIKKPLSSSTTSRDTSGEVSALISSIEEPADQSENQPSLFASQFLRSSNKSLAPLKFSRLGQSQSSLRTLNDPPGPIPQLVHTSLHVKTRDEFLEEALGSSYILWFTAFALLAGLGIGAAILIRSSIPYSWLWSMGTVLVATPLIYFTAYRKVVHISVMTIIALLSAAGAAGLTAYTSTFLHPSEINNLFLFGFSEKVSLDRQLYMGLIVGGGVGCFFALVGSFFILIGEVDIDADDLLELIGGSHLWGAIIWLGLAVLAFLVKWVSHVEWEFGFGYGWDISLLAVEAGILTPLGIACWLLVWIKGAKLWSK